MRRPGRPILPRGNRTTQLPQRGKMRAEEWVERGIVGADADPVEEDEENS